MPARYPATLPAVFDRALRKYADRTALVDARETCSYRELDERSTRLAAGLADRGVGPGDRVGVLLGNRVESPIADLAVARTGGVRVPLNVRHSTATLGHVIDDADAGTVICDSDHIESLAGAVDDGDSVDAVVVVDGAEATLPDDDDTAWLPLASVVGAASAATDAAHRSASVFPTRAPDELAGLFYTGGTTGEHKGVRYTHRCLVENLQALVLEFGFDGTDVGLLTPPLAHSAGTFCDAALLAGGTVHLREGFDSDSFVATVERTGPTWTFLVPTMLYRLLDADRALTPLATLDRIVYGAAPIRTDRLREAIDRVGPVFHQFYGQTEVPNLITSLPPREHARAHEAGDEERLTSAGTACLRASVEVRDRETDERLPPGEVGEVVVAAPYTFDGYHERPAETRAVNRDGWVHTGDLGIVDEDGYLTLVDSESGVIVTGGMNVYGTTVERALRDHPAVEDAVVVGVPHEEWGETVHAVVVASEDAEGPPTLADLGAFLDGRLAGYEQPKSLRVVDALPTTALEKIDRETVRERYWNDQDRSIH